MDENTLRTVGKWAQSKVDSGEEPPWTFHKLKQLAQITSELADGMDAAIMIETDRAERPKAPALLPENVIAIESFRSAQNAPEIALPT